VGFASGFTFGLGFGLALILVLGLSTMGLRMFGRDETDPPKGRSGLAVLTDAGTGRQYLMSPLGALTPRLSADAVERP
jgi:hypothetical protein